MEKIDRQYELDKLTRELANLTRDIKDDQLRLQRLIDFDNVDTYDDIKDLRRIINQKTQREKRIKEHINALNQR